MFAIRYSGSDNFSFRRVLRYFLIFLSSKCLERWKTNFWYNLKKNLIYRLFLTENIIWRRKSPGSEWGGGGPSPKLNAPFPINFYHIPQHIIFQKGGIWSLFLEKKILGINTISRKTILRSFPQLLVRWQLSVDKDKHCICTGTTFWYNKVRCKTGS